MGTTFKFIYIEPDGRMYSQTGEEVYVVSATLLRVVLNKCCIACKYIHYSYEEEPCKSCKNGELVFTLREDLMDRS